MKRRGRRRRGSARGADLADNGTRGTGARPLRLANVGVVIFEVLIVAVNFSEQVPIKVAKHAEHIVNKVDIKACKDSPSTGKSTLPLRSIPAIHEQKETAEKAGTKLDASKKTSFRKGSRVRHQTFVKGRHLPIIWRHSMCRDGLLDRHAA